jgi:transposase
MTRRQKDPLRRLTEEERAELEELSRAQSAPAEQVIRAKLLLAVANGRSYTQAALSVGRRSNDAVSHLVSRFNQIGVEAVIPDHGGGFENQYDAAAKARIVRELERTPDRASDGTATWSLQTLQRALRQAEDGLPSVSTYTIRSVLHEAGYDWQRSRSWCSTGQLIRKRKSGKVEVTDPDSEAKKSGLSGPTRRRSNWGLRSGVRMKPGLTRPFPIRAIVGNPQANRRGNRMNISRRAPPKC